MKEENEMKCQKCQVRPANVNVTLRINGHTEQLHVCDTCFKEIRNESLHPSGFFGQAPHGFDEQPRFGQRQTSVKTEAPQHNGLLDQLGRNLTDQSTQGLIDPVIGRDNEIKRVIETLNRRNKNNPVLIGEPGVGKTAIAEGLALKVIEGDVPTKLMNKEIYVLDVASLVANTGIRGQFEERMKQLIEELKNRPDVILFIDEIHLLVGAGTAEGSLMDARSEERRVGKEW